MVGLGREGIVEAVGVSVGKVIAVIVVIVVVVALL